MSADIQYPGDFIEGSEKDGVAGVPEKELPEHRDPFGARLAGNVFTESYDRCFGNRWTVTPEVVHEIRSVHNPEGKFVFLRLATILPAGGYESRSDVLYGTDRLGQPVHGNGDPAFFRRECVLSQPLGNRDLLGHSHLVEFDSRSRKVLSRLYEVPRVRPKAGMIRRDDDISGFP